MSELVLRPMNWRDISAAATIERELFPDDAWSVETFWAELAGVPVSRHYLVAEVSGVVVGYAGLSWSSGHGPGSRAGTQSEPASPAGESDIQTVAVAPDWRRRGIGRQLVARLVEHSDRLGLRLCLLEVRRRSATAIALYESFGFERLAVRRGYYRDGEDALIMQRTR